MRQPTFALNTALLLVAGCAVGPHYTTPLSQAPADFGHAAGEASASAPEAAWWRSLNDTTLSALIEQALVENHDLRIAQANVNAARAFATQSRLDAFPVVTAQGSVSRQKAGEAARIRGSGRTETFYDAGFDASWELDFFGRVRGSIEAYTAEYEAAIADQHDIAVTVAAEVARSYLDLRGAQYRLDVARGNAMNQEQTYALTRALFDGGRGTELDIARAQAQLDTTRARLAPLEAEVARNIHRLGVLVGQQPTELAHILSPVKSLPVIPTQFGIGDPAGLLRRRQDIRAAERRLAAATARVGVATADLFPRVSLIGSAGYLATSRETFAEGASERTTIGPFISWPAFDLGRVRARIRAADASAEALLVTYERTVLVALEETENALVDHSQASARSVHLRAAARASETATQLAQIRFRNGIDSFLNVLDAERRLLETQDELALAETATGLTFVALYKALGGGWQDGPSN